MAIVGPTWAPGNLARHFRKRMREHPDCLRDLLARPPAPGVPVSENHYELIAQDAVDNHWGEFEAEWLSDTDSEWKEAASYYLDDRLVVAITDTFRRQYITCYHKHALNPHPINKSPSAAERGNLQLAFRDWLKVATGRGKYRKVRWR